MSRKIREIRLRRLQGQLGEVAYQITKVHFSNFRDPGPVWHPAVNIFLCDNCVRICLELAGVDPDQVEVEVSPGRLSVRGHRNAPEPATAKPHEHAGSVRVLAMEIDYGPFAREISLPPNLQLERMRMEWTHGMLWVVLPRQAHA
ncbi:MAG: Hsp20/alpha crystallin family protein [Verrucomicrobia bacterium]|nr:Hsp20/alpha crystallin family protein [Verrucomicrobiota bacterium]